MALIKCKECGNKVSNKAATCPNCGAQIARKPVGCGSAIVIIIMLAVGGTYFDSMFRQERPSNFDNVSAPTAAPVVAPTPAETRQRLIESQFLLDGSHFELAQIIKSAMNNPKSYEHNNTRYTDKGDYLTVSTTFRETNAFGGVVLSSVFARVSLSGEVLEILQDAPDNIARPSVIVIGTLADTVLELRGKSDLTRQVGNDANGLLVEWQYLDLTYLMARRLQDGIEAYRVIKIDPPN